MTWIGRSKHEASAEREAREYLLEVMAECAEVLRREGVSPDPRDLEGSGLRVQGAHIEFVAETSWDNYTGRVFAVVRSIHHPRHSRSRWRFTVVGKKGYLWAKLIEHCEQCRIGYLQQQEKAAQRAESREQHNLKAIDLIASLGLPILERRDREGPAYELRQGVYLRAHPSGLEFKVVLLQVDPEVVRDLYLACSKVLESKKVPRGERTWYALLEESESD